MKALLILLLLTGCAGTIEIRMTDAETGDVNSFESTTARRQMIKIENGNITVITGQVAIDDNTAVALVSKIP